MTTEQLKQKAVIKLERPEGRCIDLTIVRKYCKENPEVDFVELIKLLFKKP